MPTNLFVFNQYYLYLEMNKLTKFNSDSFLNAIIHHCLHRETYQHVIFYKCMYLTQLLYLNFF